MRIFWCCSIHYKEADCLRQMIEPFLYNAGVDIVVHGDSTFNCTSNMHRSILSRLQSHSTCLSCVS